MDRLDHLPDEAGTFSTNRSIRMVLNNVLGGDKALRAWQAVSVSNSGPIAVRELPAR